MGFQHTDDEKEFRKRRKFANNQVHKKGKSVMDNACQFAQQYDMAAALYHEIPDPVEINYVERSAQRANELEEQLKSAIINLKTVIRDIRLSQPAFTPGDEGSRVALHIFAYDKVQDWRVIMLPERPEESDASNPQQMPAGTPVMNRREIMNELAEALYGGGTDPNINRKNRPRQGYLPRDKPRPGDELVGRPEDTITTGVYPDGA